MEASYIWKCGCGLEWRTFRNIDGPMQTHVCRCKRTHAVTGGIIQLFYSNRHLLPLDDTWIEVPTAQIADYMVRD
jgi:hypothetical protein